MNNKLYEIMEDVKTGDYDVEDAESYAQEVAVQFAASEVSRAFDCLSHSDAIVERGGKPDSFLWSGEHEGNDGKTIESLLEYIRFNDTHTEDTL